MPGVATDTELRRIIDSFIESLRRHIRVDAVILFGSYVNGAPHEWSDIDLAVISPDFEELSRWQRQELLSQLARDRDSRIQAIGYPTSEYRDVVLWTFLGEVVKTGRVVYEASEEQGAP